jgi:hypothetical protein
MVLPRTSTFVGADSLGLMPSKTRTFRNRVSGGVGSVADDIAGWAAAAISGDVAMTSVIKAVEVLNIMKYGPSGAAAKGSCQEA